MTSPRWLQGAVVVPAAPLLLPAASPAQPADCRSVVDELRELTRAALAGMPAADVTVLVAAGPRGVHDETRASLTPLGVIGADAVLPVPREAAHHLARVSQYPVFRGQPLGVGHAVLALLLEEVRGLTPVLPLSVPATTDFDVLVTVGAGMVEALREADVTATVVCAGDLSAALHEGSPRYRVDGAAEWDRAVVAAVGDSDLARLRALGPEEAARVHALGWGPLAVLHGVAAAARLRPEALGYLAPRGVGQLVARCLPRPDRGRGDDRRDRGVGEPAASPSGDLRG